MLEIISLISETHNMKALTKKDRSLFIVWFIFSCLIIVAPFFKDPPGYSWIIGVPLVFMATAVIGVCADETSVGEKEWECIKIGFAIALVIVMTRSTDPAVDYAYIPNITAILTLIESLILFLFALNNRSKRHANK